eukprot:2961819-Rhodomonas_salina.1
MLNSQVQHDHESPAQTSHNQGIKKHAHAREDHHEIKWPLPSETAEPKDLSAGMLCRRERSTTAHDRGSCRWCGSGTSLTTAMIDSLPRNSHAPPYRFAAAARPGSDNKHTPVGRARRSEQERGRAAQHCTGVSLTCRAPSQADSNLKLIQDSKRHGHPMAEPAGKQRQPSPRPLLGPAAFPQALSASDHSLSQELRNALLSRGEFLS